MALEPAFADDGRFRSCCTRSRPRPPPSASASWWLPASALRVPGRVRRAGALPRSADQVTLAPMAPGIFNSPLVGIVQQGRSSPSSTHPSSRPVVRRGMINIRYAGRAGRGQDDSNPVALSALRRTRASSTSCRRQQDVRGATLEEGAPDHAAEVRRRKTARGTRSRTATRAAASRSTRPDSS